MSVRRKKKKKTRYRRVRNIKQSRAELPLGRSASLSLREYDKHDLVPDEGFVCRYTSPLLLRVSPADPPSHPPSPLLTSVSPLLSSRSISSLRVDSSSLCLCRITQKRTGCGHWGMLLTRERKMIPTPRGEEPNSYLRWIHSRYWFPQSQFQSNQRLRLNAGCSIQACSTAYDVYLHGFWPLRGF